MVLEYVIKHERDDHLFWEAGAGWGSAEHETRFTPKQRIRLPLPSMGVWCIVAGDDHVLALPNLNQVSDGPRVSDGDDEDA